jgi:hypothetical protein
MRGGHCICAHDAQKFQEKSQDLRRATAVLWWRAYLQEKELPTKVSPNQQLSLPKEQQYPG